jgi:hypothetical protein
VYNWDPNPIWSASTMSINTWVPQE